MAVTFSGIQPPILKLHKISPMIIKNKKLISMNLALGDSPKNSLNFTFHWQRVMAQPISPHLCSNLPEIEIPYTLECLKKLI